MNKPITIGLSSCIAYRNVCFDVTKISVTSLIFYDFYQQITMYQ